MESTISWPCLSPWIHYYSCGVSFRMALEVCPFCERLYSTHSLPFHLPKCSDNPSKIKNMESRADSRKRKTKEIEEETRPTTRSLSRDSNASQRICFVCGNGFLEDDLADHEENCLRVWQQTAEHLSPTFIIREPRRFWHPSVDGTRDVTRQNSLAREQSRVAQRVRCRTCGAGVGFWQAVDHVCHQPDVQFYIPQRA